MHTFALSRRGATLLDAMAALLVLALVVALLMPAINAQTEDSRQIRCTNNLKQIGIGIQNFHDIRLEVCPSYLTTDFKTYAPTGHATWAILLLPFMEHTNEFERFDLREPIGKDVKGPYGVDHAAGRTKSLDIFFCTARRLPPQLTADKAATVGDYGSVTYGLHGGDYADPARPETYNAAMMVCRAFNATGEVNKTAIGGVRPVPAGTLGPSDFRAMTSFASVLDGLSHTAFIGEKAVHRNRLGQANEAGTHQDGMLYYGEGGPTAGKSPVTHPGQMAFWSRRLGEENAQTPVLPQQPQTDNPDNRFGGWHPNVTQFLMGDGSVRWVYNSTSNTVLQRFGTRNDRMTYNMPPVSRTDVPPDDRPRVDPPREVLIREAQLRVLERQADALLSEARQQEMDTEELIKLIRERDKYRWGEP